MILAVGYRAKSKEAIAFRKWATETLKSVLLKGYAIDDVSVAFDPRKFMTLVAHVKAMRAKEQLVSKMLLDIYATAPDYQPDSTEARIFIATVQNKFHYAVHGHTASELIHQRADHAKPLMGMLSFGGSHPVKKDIYIAKNYMTEAEISKMDRLVRRVLELSEDVVAKAPSLTLSEWMQRLNATLELTDEVVLYDYGTVKRQDAINHASMEFWRYRERVKDEPGNTYPKQQHVYILDLKEINALLVQRIDIFIDRRYVEPYQFETICHELLCIIIDSIKDQQMESAITAIKAIQEHEYIQQFPCFNIMTVDFVLPMSSIIYQLHDMVTAVLPKDGPYELTTIKITGDLGEISLSYTQGTFK
jgi:hypothetical protein